MSETCLNRESDFYKDCTFCSDNFHGYNHKCSKCFSYASSHAKDDRQPNGSFVESLNSMGRCISKTSSQLSLPHFVFLQLFYMYCLNYNMRTKIALTKNMAALASLRSYVTPSAAATVLTPAALVPAPHGHIEPCLPSNARSDIHEVDLATQDVHDESVRDTVSRTSPLHPSENHVNLSDDGQQYIVVSPCSHDLTNQGTSPSLLDDIQQLAEDAAVKYVKAVEEGFRLQDLQDAAEDAAEVAAAVKTTGSNIRMSQSMPEILFPVKVPEDLEDSDVDLPKSGI